MQGATQVSFGQVVTSLCLWDMLSLDSWGFVEQSLLDFCIVSVNLFHKALGFSGYHNISFSPSLQIDGIATSNPYSLKNFHNMNIIDRSNNCACWKSSQWFGLWKGSRTNIFSAWRCGFFAYVGHANLLFPNLDPEKCNALVETSSGNSSPSQHSRCNSHHFSTRCRWT